MPTGRPFPSLTHLLAPSAATRPRDKLGGTRRGPSLQARLLGLSGSIVVFPVILHGLIHIFSFGRPSLPCFGMQCAKPEHIRSTFCRRERPHRRRSRHRPGGASSPGGLSCRTSRTSCPSASPACLDGRAHPAGMAVLLQGKKKENFSCSREVACSGLAGKSDCRSTCCDRGGCSRGCGGSSFSPRFSTIPKNTGQETYRYTAGYTRAGARAAEIRELPAAGRARHGYRRRGARHGKKCENRTAQVWF